MSIESILETQHFGYVVSTSAITVAAGATAATATNYGNLTAGDLIRYVDDAGVLRYGQIATLPGAPNLTLETAAQAAATGNILSLQSTPTAHFFESNNAQNKSQVVTIAPANAILEAPGTQRTFNLNEGFLVKSIFLRLPYQYTLADGQVNISFRQYTTGGVFIQNILSIGEGGLMYVMRENMEIDVNAYVDPPTGAASQNYRVHAILSGAITDIGASDQTNQQSMSVSCVHAPASLNGAILPVTFGMRILHAATALGV